MNNIHIEDAVKINSDIQNISTIEKLIDNISGICQFNDELYGKLLLAVVEGVNNAIVHGNQNDTNKHVDVSYVIDNENVIFSICDSGLGFNPDSIPDPTAPENIEKVCGRGIYLMRHLSDEIEFSDNGRCVTMKFFTK